MSLSSGFMPNVNP